MAKEISKELENSSESQVKKLRDETRIRMLETAYGMCDDVKTRKYQNPTEIVNCIVKIYEATKE